MSGSLSLTPDQLTKARDAIEFLSSLSSVGNQDHGPITRANYSSQQPGPSHSRDSRGSSPPGLSSVKTGEKQNEKVLAAADKCLKTLRRVKSEPSNKRRAKEEVFGMFHKNKRSKKDAAKCAWKHRFVCLAYRDQYKIPTTDTEKDDLLQAGLGDKVIEFPSLDMSSDQFKGKLFAEFPKLRDGGGFQFCKCVQNSRVLEPLSSVTLSSPEMLKSRAGNSRTYIRPIQKDLDLTIVCDLPQGPMEQCLSCKKLFAVSELPDHIVKCKGHPSNETSGNKSPVTVDLTKSPRPSDEHGSEELPELPPSFFGMVDDHTNENPPECNERSSEPSSNLLEYSPRAPPYSPLSLISEDQLQGVENEMVGAAIVRSLSEESQLCVYGRVMDENISALVKGVRNLRKQMLSPESDLLYIDVRRDFVLQDALRQVRKKKFNPKKPLKVVFVNEGAVDDGGPKREFFRLLAHQASDKYFVGASDHSRFFDVNILAVQNDEFHNLGVYFVMSVIQGGCGFPFLAKPVFQYLVSGSYKGVTVALTDIPDPYLRVVIEKVKDAENDDEMKVIFSIDDHMDMLLATGFRKPVSSLTLSDRQSIISVLVDYHLMNRVKTEMDQFRSGLETLGLLDVVKENPDVWKPFFVYHEEKLTAETIKDIFNVKYSPPGHMNRSSEEQTWICFTDFLDDCEEETISCHLSDLLIFASGAAAIPPLGFEKKPSIEFIHEGDRPMPTSSTCDVTLRLPTKHKNNYEQFKEMMILALKSNDGFGGP